MDSQFCEIVSGYVLIKKQINKCFQPILFKNFRTSVLRNSSQYRASRVEFPFWHSVAEFMSNFTTHFFYMIT